MLAGRLFGRLAAFALAVALVLPSGAARAQDATWTGGVSGDLSDPANWVGGVVPTGMAYFGASSNTSLSSSIDGILIMRGWTFEASAPNYSYNVTFPALTLLDGVGIVNKGGSTVTLNNDYFLTFSRAATAGNAVINNSGNGSVSFESGAMADHATINNLTSTGVVSFNNNSGLGNATILNNGTLEIAGSSAENAGITNNHIVNFFGTGTGGNATIQNNGGGVVNFEGFSTGGNAVIANNAGAVVDFSGSSGLNNDHKLSIGAIPGDGNVYLGSNELSIGGTNQDITLSSVFSDCGASGNDCQNTGATGGSLVKVGAGTLTIANTNTYTGGTTVSAGKLQIGNATTAGRIVGDITVGSGTRFSAVNGNLSGIERIDNSGVTEFHNNTNPTNALITNNAGGVVDFSGSTGPAGDGKLTAGEIAGAGVFYLGSNTLTLHGGFNTTVSGVISDCGAGGTACNTPGATGGALVKSAGGTLTLTGANTYTGGTTVNAGLLVLGDATAKGSIVGDVTVGSGGIFQMINTDLGAVTTINNGGLSFFRNGTNARDITLNNNNYVAFGDTSSAGNATITNNSSLFFFTGNSTAGNAAITNNLGGVIDFSASSGSNGDHKLSAGSIAGAGDFYLGSNMLAVGSNNQNTAVSGTISDCGVGGNLCSIPGATGGMLVKEGTGDLTLSGANTYSGGTRVATGTLSLANNDALGTGAVMLDPNTTLHLAGVQIANTVNVRGDPNIAVTGANSLNSIAGSGDVNILGTSASASTDVLTLNGPNAYTADTFVGNGTAGAAATLKGGGANALSANSTTTVTANSILDLNGFDQAIGALAGAGTVTNGGANAATLTANGNNSSTAFNGVIENGSAPTALTKAGTGTLTLSGTSTFTGATTVNGGRLIVDGSIVSSSGVQVNAGGLIGGSGFLPSTVIAGGGTLAPGSATTALTVSGNLTFGTGATYAVQVSSAVAGHTNMTGTANLAGTAYVGFAPGNYTKGSYALLSAAGGLGGTTFDTLQTNMPGFVTSLGYMANDAVLTISSAALGAGQGLGRNQQNVANTINDYFNNGGMLTTSFSNIFSLVGSRLGDALSRVSGEAATGAQQSAFQLMNGFFGVMLDPAMGGAGHAGGGQALGFATERDMSPDVARAYASVFKSAIKGPQSFEPRWNIWASGFSGSSQTGGNIASGSHDSSARIYGSAGGADYHFSPDTTVGFAFAGAGTSWGLAGGFGDGRSDAFQAGLYGSRRWGSAYVSTAVAVANHWMSTDRYASAGDHLTGNFNAQSYGGRLESGYRFATLFGGITPYAAAQAQAFHTPGYNETDVAGGELALSYRSRDATDTRSELGVRYDRTMLLGSNALLTFRGRLAWAHDWVSDPSLTAAFQSLPGSGFVVGGAVPAADTLLASAGAELFMTPAWSVLARFDTELSGKAQTYAGTGTLRYTW